MAQKPVGNPLSGNPPPQLNFKIIFSKQKQKKNHTYFNSVADYQNKFCKQTAEEVNKNLLTRGMSAQASQGGPNE